MDTRYQHATYALKNNQIVSIEDVESGDVCGCICASCGAPLIAKKGEIREHHFAHKPGHKCDFEYETSLHLFAKKILSEAPEMVIPSVYVNFPKSKKKRERIHGEKPISIDRVELEPRYDGFVPDVHIYSGNSELFIEIFVTHQVDKKS